MYRTNRWQFVLACLVMFSAARALSNEPQSSENKPAIAEADGKTIYCIGYAHLDTQWRWDYAMTISEFLRETLDQNFAHFEKYPDYVFNFTGSARYELMKEYFPERYARLKKYVADGRWFVAGASVDEGDVNIPSPESVLRHALYGNEFFRREFDQECLEAMLPDSFGFQAHLPSVWAHCGLLGFSTQKLTWGSAVGIPFGLGVWQGPDGKSIIAALDPGAYVGSIEGPVETNSQWLNRIEKNGKEHGVWADFHYYGVGDIGGAPREADVKNYTASMKREGPMRVALTSASQFFKDVAAIGDNKLPRFEGDMLLTQHSAGTLTSEAYMKRLNRKGEQLADAAERAAVVAHWLGSAPYPQEKLEKSWVRLLANQMHDILPGTCIPRAYEYAWNAETVALNGFATVLEDSVGAVAQAMDTNCEGTPLIVFNALSQQREDLVEATVIYEGALPKAVRVFEGSLQEVPSQELSRTKNSITLIFLARVASIGFAVFDVRSSDDPYESADALKASESLLENEHYRVTINKSGDVSSIIDKSEEGRELLSAPTQLVFTYERPHDWPAWNMDWSDRQKPLLGVVDGPAKIKVIENGPVRVAVEITRTARNSIITQRIRLARGDAGQRVEFFNDVDWQSTECALRAAFPLTASNPKATYNLGLGTIERGNNDSKKYEVPSREWFDLTDKSGEFGVSLLEDCKFGSDKPADNLLRLTLLYTPGVRKSYMDQHSQDWGRHEFTYALYSHAGDWRKGQTEWQARRLNQPLRVFQVGKHQGQGRLTKGANLGKREIRLRGFSFTGSGPQVDIRALKRAEHGGGYVVRFQELWGKKATDVRFGIAGGMSYVVTEVDGQERPLAAESAEGKLVFDLPPYGIRTFIVRIKPPAEAAKSPECLPIELPFNVDVMTSDADRTQGGMDREGRSFPAEMLPQQIVSEGIHFTMGSSSHKNAVLCKKQVVELPEKFKRLYILAAASEKDEIGGFTIGDTCHELNIQPWTGWIGQCDNRVWDMTFGDIDHICPGKVVGIKPGYLKRDSIAWFCTHHHHPKDGNVPYRFSYLFKYGIDIPNGAREVQLPDNENIKIFAMTAARNTHDDIRPAAPLYDLMYSKGPIQLRHVYPPPPPPVFDGLKPIAQIVTDRAKSFSKLSIEPPSDRDYADVSANHGIKFRFFSGDGDYPPHGGSGVQGDAFPRLNDGQLAENDDDTKRCVWYDNEGRFYVDLGQSMQVSRVNSYSWHGSDRAPQYYSLWGSNASEMPPMDFKNGKESKWEFIGLVDTRKLGQGGVHGASISKAKVSLGQYRHFLWITEDVGQGTFFTEIDIYANPAEKKSK